MPRIGRFRRMNQSVKLDDCLLDDSFEDRIRWIKESDKYMEGLIQNQKQKYKDKLNERSDTGNSTNSRSKMMYI
jgi:hypothetical protein